MRKQNLNKIINATKEKAETIGNWCWEHKIEIASSVIVIAAGTTVSIVCKKGKIKDEALKLANKKIKNLEIMCNEKDVIINMQDATIKMKNELMKKKDSAFSYVIANGTREGSSTCASELALRKNYLNKCDTLLN